MMSSSRISCLVACLAVLGCTRGETQPIVFDRQALTETVAERAEPEVVEASPASEPATLAVPAPLDDLVAVQPGDLMTATGRSSPSVVLGPGTDAVERALREPGRVVLREHPDGAVVPFEWAAGSAGTHTRHMLLVPTRPLEPRWYSIEFRVEGRVEGTTAVDSLQVSRFRPDSHPVLQGVATATRDGLHFIEARFSERVAGSAAASEWTIADDEGPLRCTAVGPEPGREEMRATWTCDRLVVGRVQIDFGGVLATTEGEPLRSLAGVELARVEVGETVLRESDGTRLLR